MEKEMGLGKEYDNKGELMYEGEYLNGKRNGKGKEYCKGKLDFAGNFLYGVKWDGKTYDENGKVLFELNNGKGKVREYNEFNYLNGMKNGKIKGYDYSNNLTNQ